MTDETELIRIAQTQVGQHAFSTLIKNYQGKVRSFLFRLSESRAMTDDLAQDTFIQAYRKLFTFRGDSSFQTWLLAIAYRSFLQEMRRKKNESLKLEKLITENEINPSYYESVSVEQLDLERAMLHLSHHEIAAISLCATFGCSHADTAAVLKMPLGTVKTHIRRGKSKLKKLLIEQNQNNGLGGEHDL
jgi:RNA polymerase sigma-70 factor (ECF subfamily)